MNIFQVKSNINHNGTKLTVGEFFEAELAEFQHLVKDGALRLFSDVTSIDDAKALVEKEKDAAQADSAPESAPEAQNTWGPKKDDPAVPADESAKVDDKPADDAAPADEKPADVAPAQTGEPQITGDEL